MDYTQPTTRAQCGSVAMGVVIDSRSVLNSSICQYTFLKVCMRARWRAGTRGSATSSRASREKPTPACRCARAACSSAASWPTDWPRPRACSDTNTGHTYSPRSASYWRGSVSHFTRTCNAPNLYFILFYLF
jgi:hypothetical protein